MTALHFNSDLRDEENNKEVMMKRWWPKGCRTESPQLFEGDCRGKGYEFQLRLSPICAVIVQGAEEAQSAHISHTSWILFLLLSVVQDDENTGLNFYRSAMKSLGFSLSWSQIQHCAVTAKGDTRKPW